MTAAVRIALVAAILACLGAMTARAQVQVDITLKRSLYIAYEPILLGVTITNLSGGELLLRDSGLNKWFNIQVDTLDGRPIPPNDSNLSNEPLSIGAGQKVSRLINITPLFPVSDFGSYRIRASVFVDQVNRFFSSPTLNIEVTDGRVLWEKTVGVPEGSPGAGTMRTVTLLAHRLPASTQLYVRVEDKQNGVVYCTHQLGRILSFGNPNVMLDASNRVHILQNAAPKSFIYSEIGLNGEVLARKSYNEFSTRPALRRGSDGSVLIVGGQEFDPNAKPAEASVPEISERPVPLPGAPKSETEDKRPDHLLTH